MRALLIGVPTLFYAIAISGCSSGSNAPINENTGNGPHPAQGQPVVTAVSPGTVTAGGPSFTITVNGENFAQGDSVVWNFVDLRSNFVSSTQMTAQVPNTLLYEPGTATIIVQTPTPFSLNFGTPITIASPPAPGSAGFTVSTVGVEANDMVWDPVSEQIYLSVASTNPTNASTITALDPTTGVLGTSVSAGSGADRLSVSSDGSWLYAGIDGSGSVQRLALPALTSDVAISLGTGQASRPNYAFDLMTDPANPNTIAISYADTPSQAGTVAIYDGSTARSSTVYATGGYPEPLGSVAWNSSGTDLFGAITFEDDMYVLSVNSTGVQLAQSDQLYTGDSFVSLGRIHYSATTGYVYGDNGQVIDPATGVVVNKLPEGVVGGGVVAARALALTVDDSLGMAWIVEQVSGSSGQQIVIQAFDLQTDSNLGSIAIPNVVGTPVKLIRWGSSGLAFLTQGTSGPEQGDGIYLISGTFVTTPSIQTGRTISASN